MIACPRYGFVMLSLPKCASTSVVRAVQPHAEIVFTGIPKLKHVNCTTFHDKVRPILRHAGYKRKDYELVTMFREPTSWLESWWRYRSRPALQSEDADRYTGEVAFEEFVLRYLDHLPSAPGRPARFVSMSTSFDVGVDRIFQLDRPDVWQTYFQEKIGQPIEYGRHKGKHRRAQQSADLTPETRGRLEDYFAPEYDIWRQLLAGDGQWAVPSGYVAGAQAGG